MKVGCVVGGALRDEHCGGGALALGLAVTGMCRSCLKGVDIGLMTWR